MLECQRCGGCCTHFTYTQMSKHEVKRVAHHFNMPVKDIIRLAERFDGRRYLFRQPCPFLRDGNFCTIYVMRPLVCAGFPMNTFILDPSAEALKHCPAFKTWLEKQLEVFR